jgi:hypothetical protein
MPNRIVREGIIDSSRMEELVRDGGWGAEVFYRRLHQVVDDFGRFDARASVLRARCYPTVLDIVREADVQRWIAACVKAVLVRLYEVDGRAYLEVADFRQFARAKTSKFPDPPPEMHCNRTADAMHMRPYSEAETKAQPPNPPAGGLLDVPVFLKAWEKFLHHRQEKKKPVTRTNGESMLKKFEEWGVERAVAALEYTVLKGWQGIAEPDKPHPRSAMTPSRGEAPNQPMKRIVKT